MSLWEAERRSFLSSSRLEASSGVPGGDDEAERVEVAGDSNRPILLQQRAEFVSSVWLAAGERFFR